LRAPGGPGKLDDVDEPVGQAPMVLEIGEEREDILGLGGHQRDRADLRRRDRKHPRTSRSPHAQ
jgi:hypothetical protein